MSTRVTQTSGARGAGTDEDFEARLAAARSHPSEPLPHLVGGADDFAGEPFSRLDPSAEGSVASRALHGTPQLVARAVDAARSAASTWAAISYSERCEQMRGVADALSERHIQLAAVVSLETGKTRTESILEVQEAAHLIRTHADAMQANEGYVELLPTLIEGERRTDVLLPYGVFAVISPFTFPIALPVAMLAAALIAGNSAVLKPSAEAPWSGALLGQIARDAGLPPGVLNVVQGGPVTGRALVDAGVDGVAFSGSAEVGRAIARKLLDGPYARPVLTEMGGKNAAIVATSADLESAAEGVARSAFGLSGQRSSACSRAIVLDEVHDEFVERLAELGGSLKLGDPGERDASLGPVINEVSSARFENAVADARRNGEVAAGGGRPERPGHFVEPTVVTGLPRGHPLERNELLLPFVTVTRVGSFDEALAEAKAPAHGLSAGVFTEDATEEERFLAEIEAGGVYINRRAGATTGALPSGHSFAGWKSSGTTGKGGLGPWYLPQFMREQSRTVGAESAPRGRHAGRVHQGP